MTAMKFVAKAQMQMQMQKKKQKKKKQTKNKNKKRGADYCFSDGLLDAANACSYSNALLGRRKKGTLGLLGYHVF